MLKISQEEEKERRMCGTNLLPLNQLYLETEKDKKPQNCVPRGRKIELKQNMCRY